MIENILGGLIVSLLNKLLFRNRHPVSIDIAEYSIYDGVIRLLKIRFATPNRPAWLTNMQVDDFELCRTSNPLYSIRGHERCYAPSLTMRDYLAKPETFQFFLKPLDVNKSKTVIHVAYRLEGEQKVRKFDYPFEFEATPDVPPDWTYPKDRP